MHGFDVAGQLVKLYDKERNGTSVAAPISTFTPSNHCLTGAVLTKLNISFLSERENVYVIVLVVGNSRLKEVHSSTKIRTLSEICILAGLCLKNL